MAFVAGIAVLVSASPLAHASLEANASYVDAKPQWGFQIETTAPFGFPASWSGTAAGATDIDMTVEFQPRMFQKLHAGVLGAGIEGAVFPVATVYQAPAAILTPSSFMLGGVLRYQARFFRNQWVVPEVGYLAGMLDYAVSNSAGTSTATGYAFVQGPLFGVEVFLNIFEPGQSAETFADTGLARSYLTAELRMISGGDSNVTASGLSPYFGLRLEY